MRRPCIVKRASTYIRSMMSILSICVAALTIQVRCQWWYCCVQVYNLRVQLNIKYMVKPIDQLFLVRKWQAKQFLSRRPGLPFFFCCCHAASHTSTLPWPLVSHDRRTISKHKKKDYQSYRCHASSYSRLLWRPIFCQDMHGPSLAASARDLTGE